MSKHKRSTGPPCTRCTQPAAGAYLCPSCGQILEQLLAEIPALAADLDLTRARQDRMRGHAVGAVGGHNDSGPLWDERASRAGRALRDALTTEVHQLTGPRPAGTVPALAAHLLARLDTIRHTDTAARTVDALSRVVKTARSAIDRPADLVFGGPCECGHDLYARGDATHFTCPTCGTVYDFEQRRAWLLSATEDSLLTATEASRALSDLLGRTLSPNTIRTWANTGRLVPHGHHGDRPLYRVGDLVALARTTPTRQRRPAVA